MRCKMTREEAIQYWEGLRKTFSSQLEKEEKYWGRMYLQTTIDAIDTALSALRQEEQDRNEPLTLDELRKMDGEPVWVQFLNHAVGYWDISNCHNSEFFKFCRIGFILIDEYGKTWLAYRQKTEEADHA